MAEYYLTLEELYTWVERRVDRAFRDGATSILPSEFRRGVFDRHWENEGAPTDAWIENAANDIDASEALRHLRAIPGVDVALSRVIDRSHGQQVFIENSRSYNAELEGMIRPRRRLPPPTP